MDPNETLRRLRELLGGDHGVATFATREDTEVFLNLARRAEHQIGRPHGD